jgi:alpha-D-xyloside xylohydrolase
MEREVYLPEGVWYDFWTGERFDGGRKLKVAAPLERIPLFVKSGTLLPLAQPTLHTADPASFRLSVQLYGRQAATAHVFEDDGRTPAGLTGTRLSWDGSGAAGSVQREGAAPAQHYEVVDWKVIA